MNKYRNVSALALVLSLAACGGSEEAASSSAGTEEAPAPAPAAAPTPHELIVGNWKVSLPEMIMVLPEAQREPMHIAYFSLSDRTPTDEEVRAAGITGPAVLAIGLTRQKLDSNPQDPTVQRGMAALGPLAAIGVVATATSMTLTTPGGPQTMTWEMTSETGDTLTFASHEEDAVKTMTAHFTGNDTVVLAEVGSGEPPLTFNRAGSDAAAAVALRSLAAQ